MAKKNEVAAIDEQSKAVSTFEGYGEDAGVGVGSSQDELSIPFLTVLQAMSPQVADVSDGGIDGAKAGMLFNTVTEQLVPGKDGVVIIPAYKQHVFVEWVPRDQGGGLVAIHEKDAQIVADAKAAAGKAIGRLKTPTGNDLVEAFYLYGIVEEDGSPIVVGFSSTKIAVFRQWNTKLNIFQIPTKDGRKQNPPLFAHRVKISTQKQKNNKGEFFNFVLSPAEGDMMSSLLSPSDERYQAAKSLGESLRLGKAKADFNSQNKAGSDGPSPTGSGVADENGDEIPF